MRSLILCLFACFLSVTAIFAEEDRFDLLKKQRKTAINRAVDPIHDRYVSELQKLLKSLTASGKLDEALKVRDEIEIFKKSEKVSRSTKTTEAPNSKFSEDFMIATTWEFKRLAGNYKVVKFEKSGILNTFMKDTKASPRVPDGRFSWSVVDVRKRQVEYLKQIWTVDRNLKEMTSEGGTYAELVEE